MNQHDPLSSSRAADAGLAPAAIAPIDRERDGDPVLIKDARTIVAMLQEVAVQVERFTVYPSGGEPLPSGRLVEYLEPTRQFVLHVVHDQAPAAGPGVLVARPRGMKMQFEAQLAWQERPGLPWRCVLDVPTELLQTQRRRFTRRDIPLGPSLHAVFSRMGRRRVVQVDDFSMGGVGLRASAREHSDLAVGQRLDRVRLELGPAEWVEVDLEICSRRAFRSFLAGEQLHLGCRFANLTVPARATLERFLTGFEQAVGPR